VLVQLVQQRSPVEGSEGEEEVAVAVAVPQGDLPDALQAVPEVERKGVLLLLVALAGLRVVPQQVRQEVPGHQKGHPLGLVHQRDFLG
jgi:hypothetical protein